MAKHKVVYNTCFGGFNISEKACAKLLAMGSPYVHVTTEEDRRDWPNMPALLFNRDCPRHDPLLVAVVESLGCGADGPHAELAIEEIDDDKYVISEYDGRESVITPNTCQYNWTVIS